MYDYGCRQRAGSANYRCIDKITHIQVFYTLKIHDYKCVFCNGWLNPKTWHLDHYQPISQGGKNVFNNIVPSCPQCNMMKGAMTGEQFYKRCHVIIKNFRFKDSYYDHSQMHKNEPK